MVRKVLKNKPLVEAIFELRWKLEEPTSRIKIDPHYKILIGRIYDRVRSEYPFHEQLPAATMPDQIAGYIVQHRFRKGKDEWPLIQIGPGVITLNDTDGYVWEDFEGRICRVLDNIFEAYPDAENSLKVNQLLLRYIDAVVFDYREDDVFDFLKQKMKMDMRIHKKLFEETRVSKLPLGIDLRFSFPSIKPKGAVNLRFARGERKNVDALIWETMVISAEEDVPEAKNEIPMWVKDAHNLTDDWFFKMIEGELQRRFE